MTSPFAIRVRVAEGGRLRGACPLCGEWSAVQQSTGLCAYGFKCPHCDVEFGVERDALSGTFEAFLSKHTQVSGAYRVRDFLRHLWRKNPPA